MAKASERTYHIRPAAASLATPFVGAGLRLIAEPAGESSLPELEIRYILGESTHAFILRGLMHARHPQDLDLNIARARLILTPATFLSSMLPSRTSLPVPTDRRCSGDRSLFGVLLLHLVLG